MTGSGPEPATEVYEGPPPTRRPEPWQVGPVPPGPGVAPWGPAPWAPGLPAAPQPWGSQPWGSPPSGPGWGPGLVAPHHPRVVRWAPQRGNPQHEHPRPFLRVMRYRDWAWWRPLLGLL